MIRHFSARSDRRQRLLIPDATPISLLALIGESALDWLFVPGVDVWVTDMVREETVREPGPGSDQRPAHRAAIQRWFKRNEHRIRIQTTDAGDEYRKAMEAWELIGRRPDLKPSWKGRGDASILQALDAAAKSVDHGEAVVAIVDDKQLRAALRISNKVDIDLMATESFVAWMAGKFGIREADTAWEAITVAAGGKAPPAPEEDPVYIHCGM